MEWSRKARAEHEVSLAAALEAIRPAMQMDRSAPVYGREVRFDTVSTIPRDAPGGGGRKAIERERSPLSRGAQDGALLLDQIAFAH